MSPSDSASLQDKRLDGFPLRSILSTTTHVAFFVLLPHVVSSVIWPLGVMILLS